MRPDSGLDSVHSRARRPACAGDCLLRLSVYQSTVSSTDYLSVCLESKDTDKTGPSERSCWCLFRLAVTSQVETGKQVSLLVCSRSSHGGSGVCWRRGGLGWAGI